MSEIPKHIPFECYTCPKCGQPDHEMDYDDDKDLLFISCQTCGYEFGPHRPADWTPTSEDKIGQMMGLT